MLQRLAYSVDGFAALVGIGRTIAYQEIKEGRLRPVKVGRRTVITHDEAMAWLQRLRDDSAGQPAPKADSK